MLVGCMSAHNIRQPDPLLSTARPITIMTYNIRIGAGHNEFDRNLYELKNEKKFDLTPVIEAIRSVEPDIVGLQEVLGERQAAKLGKVLDMNYAYVPHGIDKYGTWWGVAVLSKFPIQEISRQNISSGLGKTRANLIANINIFGQKTVFFCIHKDPDLTEGNSLRTTIKRINKIQEPVVLMGDLNILPSDARHDILSGRLEDTAILVNTKTAEFARKRGTYPSKHGDTWGKRIDYILVDKGRFEVVDAGLINEKNWLASDHLGYYAKIKFK